MSTYPPGQSMNKVVLEKTDYYSKFTKSEFYYENFDKFKNQLFEVYVDLLEHKFAIKKRSQIDQFKVSFYGTNENQETLLSEFQFNHNVAPFTDLQIYYEDGIPKRLRYSKQKIKDLNQKIANKLIEYWNLAISFEEIEFLMRNIEKMIPIYEIGFVEKSTMIFHNIDLIERTDCYKKSFNKDYLGLLRMLREKNFTPLNPEYAKAVNEKWKDWIKGDWNIDYDRECNIKTISEFLGRASLSDKSPPNLGKILLAPILIDDYHKELRREYLFQNHINQIYKDYRVKLSVKSYKFENLIEKVYFHEVGHLYFNHVTYSTSSNPNEVRESFANSFASLIFDSQEKSLMIWLMTRFQVDEYKWPYVIKVPNKLINSGYLEFKKSGNLVFKDTSTERIDICGFDLFLMPHGNSNGKK